MKRLTKYFGWILAVLFILSLNQEGWAYPQGGNGRGKSTQPKAKVTATKSTSKAKKGNSVSVRTKAATTQIAQTTRRITVNQKPPALRKEVIPVRQNPSAVWIPGYWSWNYRLFQWIWVAGYWDLYPIGVIWFPGYWHYNDGLWIWIEGRWAF